MRRTWLVVIGTITVVGLCAGQELQREYKKDSGPFEVLATKFDWKDERRNREVPVKVYFPKGENGPLPVIVFSHGLGGTRDGYEHLGRHWASHGYVTVHPQHKDSDDAVWKGGKKLLADLRKAVREPANALNRPLDVRFVLDQLAKLNQDDGAFKGRLDLGRVGMAGPSFGGWTTQAVVGASATFGGKIPLLPPGTRYVDADSGYDVDDFQKAIEQDEQGRRTGRRFVCPENPRNGTGQKPGPAQRRRPRRRQFVAGRRGRKIYRQRSRTVEPFHEWLARVFELDRVWHRGLDNNRTQVLGAIFAYQVLLRYNHGHGASNGRVKEILDRL